MNQNPEMNQNPKHKLSKNLLKSKTWLIDGGNGSEIINLTKFATADFGALTAYKFPEAVEEVHKNYADAGANFITVNTYRVWSCQI